MLLRLRSFHFFLFLIDLEEKNASMRTQVLRCHIIFFFSYFSYISCQLSVLLIAVIDLSLSLKADIYLMLLISLKALMG